MTTQPAFHFVRDELSRKLDIDLSMCDNYSDIIGVLEGLGNSEEESARIIELTIKRLIRRVEQFGF